MSDATDLRRAPFQSPAVKAAFDAAPSGLRHRLLDIRDVVFEVADRDQRIGALTEDLRWGQPAYLTSQTRSGTTVRLGVSKKSPGHAAVFVNCQTTLISTIRTVFPDVVCEDNRAILVSPQGALPSALPTCILMALTYHLSKARTNK